ncbi:hypothetical protein ACNF49_51695 [Actinomadura sp. ATCC 39365]
MSRTRVTAIVVAHDGGRRLGDTLRALAGQSRRPERIAGNRPGARLLFTAPDGPGEVGVQEVPAKGAAGRPYDVAVPAGRTREVRLRAKGEFAVVVTPVSGQVYGGRVIEEREKDGLLVTAQPLAPARVWTVLPVLPAPTDSARVVLPG